MNYYYIVEGLVRNNIGDVLQGMAAANLLPVNAKPVDREQLSLINPKEKSFLLASGWFMHEFSKFPPPDSVQVCYISLHVANSALLHNQQIREHFKKNAPIGCRDKKTLYLFMGWGIPAYYSGCLTITTSPRKPIPNSDGSFLLVDNVDHPIPDSILKKLEQLTNKQFIRISHDPGDVLIPFEDYVKNGVAHMEYLLHKYCDASLIVTTKIHCALPCLGMGAPVILIHPNPKDPRLDTVRKYMDIISFEDILKLEKLSRPNVNQHVLMKQKKILLGIVSESVAKETNIIRRPRRLKHRLIKWEAISKAKVFRLIVFCLLKSGVASSSIKRIFKQPSIAS